MNARAASVILEGFSGARRTPRVVLIRSRKVARQGAGGYPRRRSLSLLGLELAGEIAAQENFALGTAESQRPELLAHAPPADHRAGGAGGVVDVAGGPGAHLAEGELLGDAAAEHHAQLIHQLLLVLVELIL